MVLSDILPAVPRILANPALTDLRAAAYLSTYPQICGFAPAGTVITHPTFLQLATMTYGWMPRILRIDGKHIAAAITALNHGAAASGVTFHAVPIIDLALCLHSVVGASKMLHFVNPAVFPIWDSKVESFRLGYSPSHVHMNAIANYVDYARDVHSIMRDPSFPAFNVQFIAAYHIRLGAMGIAPYPVEPVRVVEASLFELA
jgi:hypothetical protein